MSVKAMSRVWELDVGHAQQAVLLAMADHANDEGGEVFPSTGLVAWKCGYSKRQVQRIIDGMEAAGLLERVAEAHGWRAVEYRICFEVASVKSPYEPSRKGRGDRMSPQEGCQDDAPQGRQDVTPGSDANSGQMSPPGATFAADRGDIALSPRTQEEPSKEPPVAQQQSSTAVVPRGDLIELSNRLAEGIRGNDQKAKVAPESKAWLEPLRLLIDRDGRTADEVSAVIDWILADDFEHRVVLSPSKLRERFTELALKAGAASGAPEPEFPDRFGFKFRRPQQPSSEPTMDSAWLAEHPATPELEAEWSPIRARLAQVVDAPTFRIWLESLHLHGSDGELVLGCDRGKQQWLTERFGRVIAAAVEFANGGVSRDVRIVECGCGLVERAA